MVKILGVFIKIMLWLAALGIFIFCMALAESLDRQAAMYKRHNRAETSPAERPGFIANIGELYVYEDGDGGAYAVYTGN